MNTIKRLPLHSNIVILRNYIIIFENAVFSTISSGLNSLSAVVLQDLIKPYCAPKVSDQRATLISKGLGKYNIP